MSSDFLLLHWSINLPFKIIEIQYSKLANVRVSIPNHFSYLRGHSTLKKPKPENLFHILYFSLVFIAYFGV